MGYIGPSPNPGQNREVDDISSGFNGSTTAFTLQVNSQNVSPGSSNAIIVSLGGVVQNPGTDYTIAASTLTFTTAPASGLSFFGLVLGQQVDIQSLADGTSPTMASPTITGDLTVDTSTLKVDASNNRVGIGIASPESVLHVSNAVAAGSDNFLLRIQNPTNASDARVGMFFHVNAVTGGGSDGAYIESANSGSDNGDIRFGNITDLTKTERMRIDSAGRLLLGTTTEIGKFTVRAANNSGSAAYGITNSGKASEGIDVGSATVGDGNFGGAVSFGCGGNGRSGIAAVQTGSDDDRNGLVFLVHPSTAGSDNAFECARFMADGFLKAKGNSASYHSVGSGYHELIGDTAHDVVAKLKHNSSTGYGLQTNFNHNNASIYAFAVRDYSGGSNTDVCFIRTDGDLENANNSYGGTSDIKLKENIVDAKSQWDDIKALKVRNFNYKSDENKTKFLGLVAQEAETVCPSLVKIQPDLGENNEDLGTETKVLKYSILYMKAVKALQEAQTRIEVLETKVAALEAA